MSLANLHSYSLEASFKNSPKRPSRVPSLNLREYINAHQSVFLSVFSKMNPMGRSRSGRWMTTSSCNTFKKQAKSSMSGSLVVKVRLSVERERASSSLRTTSTEQIPYEVANAKNCRCIIPQSEIPHSAIYVVFIYMTTIDSTVAIGTKSSIAFDVSTNSSKTSVQDDKPEERGFRQLPDRNECNLGLSNLAHQDPRESFDELTDSTFDFSRFVLNRLNVQTLTPELLAGPTYELMKALQ
ncbi:hypothetical protein Tco_0728198 [Tanacetum coccineum]|uniref:Uncharacterized protein n=1 Tax=Tanacetum coccineum TaxID=301880 RepID=A0ABQ4YLB8_9ASTR